MTAAQILSNVKCELNLRAQEYQNKIEDFLVLAEDHPEHSKYMIAAERYQIRYYETQDMLAQLN